MAILNLKNKVLGTESLLRNQDQAKATCYVSMRIEALKNVACCNCSSVQYH